MSAGWGKPKDGYDESPSASMWKSWMSWNWSIADEGNGACCHASSIWNETKTGAPGSSEWISGVSAFTMFTITPYSIGSPCAASVLISEARPKYSGWKQRNSADPIFVHRKDLWFPQR